MLQCDQAGAVCFTGIQMLRNLAESLAMTEKSSFCAAEVLQDHQYGYQDGGSQIGDHHQFGISGCSKGISWRKTKVIMPTKYPLLLKGEERSAVHTRGKAAFSRRAELHSGGRQARAQTMIWPPAEHQDFRRVSGF